MELFQVIVLHILLGGTLCAFTCVLLPPRIYLLISLDKEKCSRSIYFIYCPLNVMSTLIFVRRSITARIQHPVHTPNITTFVMSISLTSCGLSGNGVVQFFINNQMFITRRAYTCLHTILTHFFAGWKLYRRNSGFSGFFFLKHSDLTLVLGTIKDWVLIKWRYFLLALIFKENWVV